MAREGHRRTWVAGCVVGAALVALWFGGRGRDASSRGAASSAASATPARSLAVPPAPTERSMEVHHGEAHDGGEPARVIATGFADPTLPPPPPPSPENTSEPPPPVEPRTRDEEAAKRVDDLAFLAESEARLERELADANAAGSTELAHRLTVRLQRTRALQVKRTRELETVRAAPADARFPSGHQLP
jgi:hypothetical protein